MTQAQKTPLPTSAEVNVDLKSKGQAVVDAINARVLESWTRMSQWDLVTKSLNDFWLYYHGNREGVTPLKYRMNMVQGVCIANAAIQVGDRPGVKFMPRETGERPKFYANTDLLPNPLPPEQDPFWITAFGQAVQGLRPETLGPTNAPDGQEVMPQPLTDLEASTLKHQIEVGEAMRMQALGGGQPEPMGLIPPEFLIEVNDMTTAEAAQTIFDIKAEQSNFSRYVVENVLNNNIFGWQMLLCEFDDENVDAEGRRFNKFIFRNPEFLTVHLDPFKTDIRDCQWAVADEFLGADEAISMYPELTKAIDDNATQGPPPLPGEMPIRTPLPWFQPYLGRRMIIVRTAWLRNEPFPMTPEVALKSKRVIAVDVPVEAAPTPAAPKGLDREDPGFLEKAVEGVKSFFGMGGSEDAGTGEQPAETGRGGSDAGIQPTAESDGVAADGLDAVQTAGVGPVGSGDGEAPIPQTRKAYFLLRRDGTQDDETGEVDQSHPKWPQRRGLRQIRIIAGTLVSDGECERYDIPLGHNVNIPICFTPYGQGEPERLEPLQRAYNNTLHDIVTHGDQVAFPAKLALKSLVQANPALARNAFVAPNTVFPVEDRLAVQIGGLDKAIVPIPTPDLPADSWKREAMLSDKFDRESDQANILRGQLPGKGSMNPETLGQLQTAAKTSITFKSGRTVDMLKYLVRIMLADICFRMTPDELADEVRKCPRQVWYEFHRRLQYHCLECDISINITSSAGKESERQGVLAADQAGIPLSPQTKIKAINQDPDIELKQTAEWQRKVAMMASQQPSGAKPAQPGAPSNPNQPQEQPQEAPAEEPAPV